MNEPVFFAFSSYPGAEPDPSTALRPAIYANLNSDPQTVLQGAVVDTDGNPLADATVRGSVGSSSTGCLTLSEADGTFTLKAPANTAGPVVWSQASKPGYSVAEPVGAQTCVLEPWRDESWSRRWVASAPGTIEIRDGSTILQWPIASSDRFYVGDFDGDGGEELLLCAVGSQTDKMALIKFDGHWRLHWSNEGDPAAGGGIYPYRESLVVGDFDGDGRDEVIGTDAHGNWVTMFKYDSEWQWRWSSFPGAPGHALKPHAKNLRAGKFFGPSRDVLLGTAGWNTIFRFDAASDDWQWVDSDYGTTNDPTHPMSVMRPYDATMLIGDFDGDGRDEILGVSSVDSWVTMFGIRDSGTFEWLLSNSGSAESSMSGLAPYQPKLIGGRFYQPNRSSVLGVKNRAAMYGYGGEDFVRLWGSTRTLFAGMNVLASDKIIPISPVRAMPDYLLVVADVTKKSSMIAFDPLAV